MLFLLASTLAQDSANTLGSVMIASPTAASLGKFGDLPVSYHTGTPNVSIPIYTVSSGPLQIPITLSYHASGLKVMEPAGWVGAGWALDAGGVITRTVVGLPDECGTGSGAQTKGHYSNYGYNSYLYNAGQQDWLNFANGQKDGEPDLFFFNFAGHAGKFYFRDDRTPILVPQQDIQIIPSYSGGRSIDYFTLVTPDGTRYVFGNSPGISGAAPIETTNSYSQRNGGVTSPPTASWYLNKVVSADGQFVITFSYQAEAYSYYTISMYPIAGPTAGGTNTGYDLVKNVIHGVRLSQILFSNGAVNFLAGALRTDLADSIAVLSESANGSAASLGSIQITDSSGFCKSYAFHYGYFQDNTTTLPSSLTAGYSYTTDRQRLRLDSINESSCDNLVRVPPYRFSYYSSATVPRRLSFGVDHWGFYNGQSANTKLIPTVYVNGNSVPGGVRDASWPEMLRGTLTRIDYPTGGHDSLSFESNYGDVQYTYPGTNTLADFAFHIYGQSATSGTQTFTSNGNDIIFTFSTTCNYGGPLTIYNSSGASVYSVTFNNNNHDSITPIVTTYSLPGSSFPSGTYTVTASLSASPGAHISGGIEIKLTQSTVLPGTESICIGGIRIRSVIKSSGAGQPDQVTNYSYTTPGGTSMGVVYSQPTYAQSIRNDLIASVGYWTIDGYQPNSLITNGCPAGAGYYYVSPGSIRPMAAVQGSPVGYRMVTVSQPGNGSVVYTYYTDNGSLMSSGNVLYYNNVNSSYCDPSIPNFPAAPLPFDSKKGELYSEQYYDNSGRLLKDVYYTPAYDLAPVLSTPAFIVRSMSFGGVTMLLGTNYSLNTVRKTSMQVIENDYSTAGGGLTKTSIVYYGSRFHTQATRTVESTSAGDSLVKNVAYVQDVRLPNCDTISDCSAQYNSNCLSCQTTYNTARTSCAGSSSCLTTAYLNYQQCLTNSRTGYVSCRSANYTGSSNAFAACHLSAESAADTILKPLLVLQDCGINATLETSSWKNTSLSGAGLVTYRASTSPSGFAYPDRAKVVDLQSLSGSFTPVAVASNHLTLDSRYADETLLQFANGQLQSATKHDGITTAYLWDYKNQHPIAKVVNATADQAAYTSFEADGAGGWTIGSATRSTGGVTGSKYFTAAGNLLKSGLSSVNTYAISYWTTGSATPFTITGTISGYPVKGRSVTLNGVQWTCYEHKVTGQSTISISGSGNIDELRLYPSAAQMTTHTYSPLVGITSDCDMDSRIIYYQYDGLGRLGSIRDQDGNVVKTIDYHYQGQ